MYLLYAFGNLNDAGTEIRNHLENRGVLEINFLPDVPPPVVPPPVGGGDSLVFFLVHIGSMLLAWCVATHTRNLHGAASRANPSRPPMHPPDAAASRVVLSPISILLARYFKVVMPKWFAVHRGLMVTATLAVITGTLVIFAGWWMRACLVHRPYG